jgi:flagellum-specific peptidoglycan hydrolase FlgJ
MMTKEEFIKKYGSFAIQSAKGTGISPLLILSQAYLESGGAKSKLASVHYNFFGIKADKNWVGKKVLLKTREQRPDGSDFYVNAYFRKYDNPSQSFSDHIKFLKNNPRYTKAGLFSYPDNYQKQADTLQKAGYATDISYASKLTSIANSFKDTYDKIVSGATSIAPLILLLGFILYWKNV